MRTRSGINALNPQGAEIAFAGTAVAISILTGFGDRLLGDLNGVFATAVIAFRF